MLFKREPNADYFIFDSMAEIINGVNPATFRERSTKFVGRELPTWNEALEAANREWPEGLSLIQRFVKELEDIEIPELKSHKRRVRFGEDEGDEVEYDRLLTGQPFWRSAVREESTGPTEVTIFIDAGGAAAVKSEDLLWRGAAALALTKILEDKGYRVELWVTYFSKGLYRGTNRKVLHACRLKRTSDPLDMSTLVNQVSGWFFRTTMFALFRTTCEVAGERWDEGLGYHQIPSQRDLDAVSRDDLRIVSAGLFSYDSAVGMIRDEISRISREAKFEDN